MIRRKRIANVRTASAMIAIGSSEMSAPQSGMTNWERMFSSAFQSSNMGGSGQTVAAAQMAARTVIRRGSPRPGRRP